MADLNYKHLRYFREVAVEGNLTRAASRLNVSQSALSVQIQKLEQSLGQELFERRGKQLLLTEAGRIALDHANEIFATGDSLFGILAERGETARRVLRVGALSTLSRNFQIQFLRPLVGRPDVEIVVRSGGLGELLQALEAHRIDVLLSNTAPPRDSATPWVAHRLAEQTVSLIGHPSRIAEDDDLRSLLAREQLVLPTVESSIRSGFDALADRLGIRPKIAAEVDDMAMLRLMTRENIGLSVVPPIVVRDELAGGLLREAARLPDLTEQFFALTLSRRFPNPLVQILMAEREEFPR